MNDDRKLISTSKSLSLVLRHKPRVIDVQLDPEGWVDVETLIRQANAFGKPMTLELLICQSRNWKKASHSWITSWIWECDWRHGVFLATVVATAISPRREPWDKVKNPKPR